MAKSSKRNNLGLAGVFVLLVVGLIFLSLFVKTLFFIRDTKFDGKHSFNLEVSSKDYSGIISLSPQTRSISIIDVSSKYSNFSKDLEIPIDAKIYTSSKVSKDNLSTNFLKLILPFGFSFKDMNYIDAFRIFIFSRSVLQSSIYQREISDSLNSQQKSTVVALTFTDPTIYQENKSIEIVNATQTYGLGSRLANFVTNIGGDVILVTSPLEVSKNSQIQYFGDKSYTVERLSRILKFPIVKSDKKSISDVIIIIGEDNKDNF